MSLSEEELGYFKSKYTPDFYDDLVDSVSSASKRDPARFSKDLELAESQELPVATVERNRDEVTRKQKLGLLDFDELRHQTPKTAKYLSNRDNASVSFNDIENLKVIEKVMQQEQRGFWNNNARATIGTAAKITGDLIQLTGNLGQDFAGYMDSIGVPNPGIIIEEDGVSWSWDIPTETPSAIETFGAGLSDDKIAGYVPNFTWENLKGDVSPGNLAGYIIEQGASSIPHMAAAMYTLPAYIASRTEDIAEKRVANNQSGEVTKTDLATALPVAVAVALSEKLGAKFTFGMTKAKTAKDVGKAFAAGAAVEGGTEFLQEGLEYLGETLGTKKELNAAEMLDRQLAGLVAGAGIGGGIKTTTATTEALIGVANRNLDQRGLSEIEQNTLDGLIEGVQQSETLQNAPKQFREFAETLDEDQAVHFNQDAFDNMSEETKEALEPLLTSLDSETSISVADFITEVVPNSQVLEEIRPHIRLGALTLSQNELDAKETDAQLLIERVQEKQAELSEIESIYDQVKDQLVDTTRMSEKNAKIAATVPISYIQVKAEELGVSASEVFKMMDLDIVGPGAPDISAPIEDAGPTILPQQDFEGLTLKESVVRVAETGKKVKITQKAQKVWDQTQKRRGTVDKVVKCLR